MSGFLKNLLTASRPMSAYPIKRGGTILTEGTSLLPPPPPRWNGPLVSSQTDVQPPKRRPTLMGQ